MTPEQSADARARLIAENRDLPGAAGAYWRFVTLADAPIQVFRWIAGEKLRGTDPAALAEVMSGIVADLVFAVSQNVVRGQMRNLAQRIMIDASETLEQSIAALQVSKKQTAIHNAGLRLVPGSDDGKG